MSTYDISQLTPAEVLAAAYNNSRVNGYVVDGPTHGNTFSNESLRTERSSPCPEELREASLSVETAEMILEEARREQNTEDPFIESINGRWLRLQFQESGTVLHATHQIIGDRIEGAEQYSADHGVDLARIIADLQA